MQLARTVQQLTAERAVLADRLKDSISRTEQVLLPLWRRVNIHIYIYLQKLQLKISRSTASITHQGTIINFFYSFSAGKANISALNAKKIVEKLQMEKDRLVDDVRAARLAESAMAVSNDELRSERGWCFNERIK